MYCMHTGQAIGTGLNISNAQIQSQIDVLNEDYRRLNADTINTPSEFQGVAADAKSLDISPIKLDTDAPNTLRIPISLIRCSAVNDASPNRLNLVINTVG